MQPDFWHQRWADNQIGFHQSAPTPLLLKHWPALVTATMRSAETSATAAGGSTRPPSDSDSSALPALLRLVRFSKRVTKP